MPMLRANFPKGLEEGLNAVWMASEKMYPLDWPKIFEQKNISDREAVNSAWAEIKKLKEKYDRR